MANFLLLLARRIAAILKAYFARVAADGGTIVDRNHTKEVYADTYPYEPTLIQPCNGGGSTPQNFAVGSEDISNSTYWAVSGVTATSDAEPNPFGGSGVSLVAETGAGAAKGFYQQSGYEASIVTGQAYTVSAYVKKGDGSLAPDIIQVTYLSGGFGTDFYANYNISTGVVAKVGGGFADIQDIGGGWYRISLAGVAVSTGALGTFVLAFVNNDPNATRLPSYTGNTSRDVYVWGVQFVQGNEPGQYIKTTTAAIDSIGTLYSIIPSLSLLNRYSGAAAAYSLRSLSTSTTNVVKVRRSGDDAESDFTASQVSDEALAAWVRAGGGTEDGFVTTWYDQSGNANNATQTTAADQPKIVSGGTLVAENGKAAMSCDLDFLEIPSSTSTFNFLHNGTTSAVFGVVRYGNSANPNPDQYSLIGNGSWQTGIRGIDIGYSDAESASRFDASTVLIGGASSASALSIDSNKITPNEVCLHSVFLDSDNATASLRAQAGVNAGALFGTNTLTSTISSLDAQYNLCIGAYKIASAVKVLKGALQEVIIYDSDQSANRTGIEANINDYYNIYP